MPYRFHPPLWSIAGTVLVGGLFLTAGVWQLDRAHQKEALQASFAAAGGDSAVVSLSVETARPDELVTVHGRASGSFESQRQLLLDGQTREQVPGYRVWTPLKLAQGGWLIVDRGWVKANPDRRELPDVSVPEQAREVSGYWRPLPQPGLRLAADPCAAQDFPRVVSYPTREQLACVFGGPVADGVLLLDPTAADGYVREWALPNPVPPARHYAYAAQWFAFAATLLFLFVKLNLRRLP